MNQRKNIVLLYGGRSGEHEVSCRSAASVCGHIDTEKFNLIPVGISLGGEWFLQTEVDCSGEILSIDQKEANRVSLCPGKGLTTDAGPLACDLVFPVCHGTFGEDGTLQGLLEMLDLPYAGAGVMASAVGMDKDLAKRLWAQADLPVLPFLTLSEETPDADARQMFLENCTDSFGFPLFLKPARGGSSVGIEKADNEEEFLTGLDRVFRFDDKVMVEPAIAPREIEVSVLGNLFPRAYGPGEVVPEGHQFYDYEAKYLDPQGALLKIPADLDAETELKVKTLAVEAYRCLDTEGMARVDFFIDENTGDLYLNEINTIPGFTSISMFAKMCGSEGISYAELISRLIDLGLERHRRRSSLTFSLTTKTTT